MPRNLGDRHTLIIQDNVSNSEIHLYHRMPEAKEIVSYRNGNTKRVRNQFVDCTGENRLKYGKKILQGFRDGDFESRNNKGKWVPVASDPDSKNYDPEWKKLVETHASDLIELLAVHVFDASGQKITPDEEEFEDEGIEGN